MAKRKKAPPPPETDLFGEIADRLIEHERVQTVFDRATSFFDDMGILIDQAAKRAMEAKPARTDAYRIRYQKLLRELEAARERQAKAPPRVKKESPRQILCFNVADKLTVEIIKKRQREFAKIVHPDRPGGSTEAMQRINTAAAELIKELS